jgi:hypothetical protein
MKNEKVMVNIFLEELRREYLREEQFIVCLSIAFYLLCLISPNLGPSRGEFYFYISLELFLDLLQLALIFD